MSREYFYRAPHSIVFAKTVRNLYKNHKTNFDGINIGAGGTRHTSLDWFLVPKERPSIEKASVKEHYIDIPGANGGLDLTESLTGFPLYDYIEGEFEFTVLNERKLITVNNKCEKTKEIDISWEVLNRDIREFLNGKERYMMLEDDPSWYYVGRFTVGKYDSSESANSRITISYKVYPYKRLSTFFNVKSTENFRESYFDANPLFSGDTRDVINSYWNKVQLNMYPGDSKQFVGTTAGQLPCGSESVSVSFAVRRNSTALTPCATFERPDKTINTYLNAPVVSPSVATPVIKPRGFVLTNTIAKGILYSDNKLTLTLSYPDSWSSTKTYKKDDIVRYNPSEDEKVTNINLICKAKHNDVTGSFSLLSDWDIDTSAMNLSVWNEETSYLKDSFVINYDLLLFKALKNVPAGTALANEEYYEQKRSLTPDEFKTVYNPVIVSVIYDIGVM